MPESTSVAEKPAGTSTEPKGQQSPNVKGETPASVQVSSKTYTEDEIKAITNSLKSDWGRERKALEKERDSYRAQFESLQSDIADKDTEIEGLQSKIEGLSEDDPDKFNIAKELKEAREEKRKLKSAQSELETQKREYGDLVTESQKIKSEQTIFTIAQEYDTPNYDKLFDLCETFNATSEEQIRKVADTLWTKKTGASPANPTQPRQPLKLDNGGSGGRTQTKYEIMQDYTGGRINAVEYDKRMREIGEKP